jgi:hypothetical protein
MSTNWCKKIFDLFRDLFLFIGIDCLSRRWQSNRILSIYESISSGFTEWERYRNFSRILYNHLFYSVKNLLQSIKF